MNRFLFILLLFLASACAQSNTSDPLVKRGKSVYQVNCTTCHASNPSQPGPVGPSLTGSSKELITARIMRANYPEGYVPKSETHVMQALPHLEKEIDALTAYLQSVH